MTEVAKLAGVSQATVSYVINGLSEAKRIPPDTQKRVLQACKKLNYEPDYLATSMATGKTGVIGVLFPSADSRALSQMISGLQAAMRERDKQIALCITDDNAEHEAQDLKSLLHRQVDGIVAFPVWSPAKPSCWDQVFESGKPCVFLDSAPAGVKADCIHVDNNLIGSQAAQIFKQERIKKTILVTPKHKAT